MNSIRSMSRLFVAMMFVMGSVPGVSAQTMGSTLASFNILANTAVTLTGTVPLPLVLNRVGISPFTAFNPTNASAINLHQNDLTAVNGKAEGQALWISLAGAVGSNPDINLATNVLDPAYIVGGGITLIKSATDITETDDAVTFTGDATSILIFQPQTFISFTNFDILLAGGILPSNVYWQVPTSVDITNNDAAPRKTPGTFINNTGAQNITVVVSDGSLRIGRLVSLQGEVSVTKSAGTLDFDYPANGTGVFVPGCSDGLFYPSPATGATGTFSYCMESAGDVNIRVYNVIGDLAAKIEDTKAAGQHASTLDTARLAPGVYLYILERSYVGGNKSRSKVKKFVVKH